MYKKNPGANVFVVRRFTGLVLPHTLFFNHVSERIMILQKIIDFDILCFVLYNTSRIPKVHSESKKWVLQFAVQFISLCIPWYTRIYYFEGDSSR